MMRFDSILYIRESMAGADLRADFHKGNFSKILKRTVDSPSGAFKKSESDLVLGALTFAGRMEEAESLLTKYGPTMKAEALAASRFFLGTGHCRQSGYEPCRRHLVENLRAARKSKSPAVHFFAYQGIAYYRYYCGRYRNALLLASRAFESANLSKLTHAKALATDLIGHALVHLGQISQGLAQLNRARALVATLGKGGFSDAFQMSIAYYSAQHGLSPQEDIKSLEDLYERLSPENSFSRSDLLLELGRQLTLRGKLVQSKRRLDEACRLIYSSGHRRQGATLNLRYAQNYYLEGEFPQALNLLRSTYSALDRQVDKVLDLQVAGFERKVLKAMGLPQLPQELENRIRRLSKVTGRAVAARVSARIAATAATYLVSPGEDPLGNLVDKAQAKDASAISEILKSGYLSLLPDLLQLAAGKAAAHAVYVDVVPGALLTVAKGNVELAPQGTSTLMRQLLKCLRQGEATKEQLIEKVWGYRYDPLRHDPLIYPAISRLRHLLGDQGKAIEATEKGYRLSPDIAVFFLGETFAVPTPVEEKDDSGTEAALNYRQITLLRQLDSSEFIDVKTYTKQFEISRITATRDLSDLCKLALLKRVGKGRAVRYSRPSPIH